MATKLNKFFLLFLIIVLTLTTFIPVAIAEVDSEAQRLDNVRQLIDSYYVDPVSEDILSLPTVEEMLSQLDRYSEYMERADYESFINSISPQFSGIGVQVEAVEEGLLIMTVFDDGGAREAGIQTGDIIIEADGVSLVGMPLDFAVSHVRGENGSEVELLIYRPNSEENLSFSVTRRPISVPIVTHTTLGGNVGYVALHSFGSHTAAEMTTAIESLGDVDHYIFDLRNNAGGYLNAARDVVGFFEGVDRALRVQQRNINNLIYSANKQDVTFTQPVSLLVNNFSASASEIVAAALKDYDAAKTYGQLTFGKGTVQSLLLVNPAHPTSSDILKLTTGRLFSPEGKAIQDVGVTPTIKTEVGKELIRAHDDFLQQRFSAYRSFESLGEVPTDKTFTVTFSAPVNWDTANEGAFELIELGGESHPFTFEAVADDQLKIIPDQPLNSDGEFLLYVHPGIESASGQVLEEGYSVALTVE